jgi:hypothetical protein
LFLRISPLKKIRAAAAGGSFQARARDPITGEVYLAAAGHGGARRT